MLFVHDGIDGFDAGVTEAVLFQSGDAADGCSSRGTDIVLENAGMCARSQLEFG